MGGSIQIFQGGVCFDRGCPGGSGGRPTGTRGGPVGLSEREGGVYPQGGCTLPLIRLPNCYIPFPLTVEGVEVGGLLDTCSPYLFITEKIFSEFEGEEGEGADQIQRGVGGKVRVQEWW